MPDKRILITGGFGFVGSYLVEALLHEGGNLVHVVDNMSSSPIDVESFLKRLGRPPQLTWDIQSIAEYCANGPKNVRFDEIYHLASVVGPVGVLNHSGKITQSITTDTYLVLELARKMGARLCDISTSEVYGGGRDGYCSEKDAKIITPKTSVRLEYAVAKLACEISLINTTKVSDLHITIVRPFNIAGARQSPTGGFVLPRFIGQALAGEPITVYGDGRMIRAFTHVADIVDGIVRTCRLGKTGEAYNIGNPINKMSILDLAKRVIELTNSRSEILFVDPKALFGPLFEEANDKFPDADKAASELKWSPKHGIDFIIRDAIAYIQEGRRD